MSFPPNLAYFDTLISELDREYDIPVRLSRYKSAAPELLTLVTDAGLSEDEATRALFVADFIATSSEVPFFKKPPAPIYKPSVFSLTTTKSISSGPLSLIGV